MTDKRYPAEGWGFPALAKKAHYFQEGSATSICGGWMYTGPREPDEFESSDDCKTCRKKLAKLQNKGP